MSDVRDVEVNWGIAKQSKTFQRWRLIDPIVMILHPMWSVQDVCAIDADISPTIMRSYAGFRNAACPLELWLCDGSNRMIGFRVRFNVQHRERNTRRCAIEIAPLK